MELMRDRINTFFKYKDLLRELVVRDLKLKYRRSFLGYLWSILNPLLIMIVMTIVFSHMFRPELKISRYIFCPDRPSLISSGIQRRWPCIRCWTTRR